MRIIYGILFGIVLRWLLELLQPVLFTKQKMH